MKNFNNFLNEQTNETFQYNDVIDYTLLDNDASDDDIIELCVKAKQFGTKSVCVMPKHVSIATQELQDSPVLVCTVISFPEGNNSLDEKISETEQVISDGADEVDMVLNYQKLKEMTNVQKDYDDLDRNNDNEDLDRSDDIDDLDRLNQDNYGEIFHELVEEVETLVDI